MTLEDLKQFKDQDYCNSDVAEAYAKVRLGLGDDWCACAWSHCFEEVDVPDFDQWHEMIEDDEPTHMIVSDIETTLDECTENHILPKGQMYVKMVNAPDLKAARLVWNDEGEIDYKICLVDWELIKMLLE